MKTIYLLSPLKSTRTIRGMHYYVFKFYDDMFKKRNIQLIYITPSNQETYKKMMDMCDGLFLPGGADVDAAFYHEDNHPANLIELNSVDQMDLDLIKIADEMNKPVIGICRGMQIINVAYNGTLYQDINSLHTTDIDHQQDRSKPYCHDILVEEGSTLANYFSKRTAVNSFHHQCVKDLSKGFKVMAYSEDGFIEAMEKENVLAVQWHPEKIDDENQERFMDMVYDFIK